MGGNKLKDMYFKILCPSCFEQSKLLITYVFTSLLELHSVKITIRHQMRKIKSMRNVISTVPSQ